MKVCKYTSTKEYKDLGPVAYRQWRAESHCNKIHGYSLSFKFEFSSDELDIRNWCMDYGGLRPLKDFLEEHFDHRLLVALDDPLYDDFVKLENLGLASLTPLEKLGCECIADVVYEYVNTIFLKNCGEQDRVWCTKVEVRETESNMAYRSGYRDII